MAMRSRPHVLEGSPADEGCIVHLAGKGSQNQGLWYVDPAGSIQTPATVALPDPRQESTHLARWYRHGMWP